MNRLGSSRFAAMSSSLSPKRPFGVLQARIALSTKVGDTVPVSFMKDVPDPVIKEDGEYPEWVFTLGDKSSGRNLSKAQLLKKIETEGIESLTLEQMMRAKRMITIAKIKDNNMTGK